MAKKEKEVKKEESFNVKDVVFDELDEKGKKEVFDKLKNQNEVLASLVKDLNEKVIAFDSEKEKLELKAAGKVSDDTYMRLVADFENFKRRNQTATSEAFKDGKIEILKGFLDIIDNLERAIATITDEASKKGVELILKQCNDKLDKFNVNEIDALNKPFDPNLHNAVMQVEAENEEQVDTCVEVFQKGYMLDDKVLRYSFVKVAK